MKRKFILENKNTAKCIEIGITLNNKKPFTISAKDIVYLMFTFLCFLEFT